MESSNNTLGMCEITPYYYHKVHFIHAPPFSDPKDFHNGTKTIVSIVSTLLTANNITMCHM